MQKPGLGLGSLPGFCLLNFLCYTIFIEGKDGPSLHEEKGSAMDTTRMTNAELLSLLLGKEKAITLSGLSLSQMFHLHPIADGVKEEGAAYHTIPKVDILLAARELYTRALAENLQKESFTASDPKMVGNFLIGKLAGKGRETFSVLFFDNQNRLIAYEEMFHGDLSHCGVSVRPIVQKALEYQASSVILSHNHPSGTPIVSEADRTLTTKIAQALALLDIRVMDHVIVTGNQYLSFAEKGMSF